MEAALGVIGAAVFAGGLIWMIVRKAGRDQKVSLAGPIAQANAAMARAAETLQIAYQSNEPDYGAMAGEIRGVPVEVRIDNYEGIYNMVVCARGAKDMVKPAKQQLKPRWVEFRDGWLAVAPGRELAKPIKVGLFRHSVLTEPADIVQCVHQVVDFVSARR